MIIPKVTSIGEILFDIYPDEKRLGGAPFNFIYHVWKILGKANFISSVGYDENGIEMFNRLNKIGFPTEFIFIDKKYPTGTVNVRLDENKTPIFQMSGKSCFDYFALDEKSKIVIEKETDLLYFGTFAQRNETARQTIQSTFGKKIKYFCDLNLRHDFFTKEMIAKSLQTSNVVKMNNNELELLKQYFDLSCDNETAIKELITKFEIDLISITLGSEGAITSDGKIFDNYKPTPINPVDSLGAGDAFSALLCIGYLYDWNIPMINKHANQFAAEICMINGAVPNEDGIYQKYRELISN